jgi:hypothetical protein
VIASGSRSRQEGLGGFTFTYDVEDSAGNRSSATVTVQGGRIGEPNRAPVARPDVVRTVSGRPVEIDVLANDDDPDGDPIVVLTHTQGAHGAVELVDSRTLRYVPDRRYTGTDVFTYVIEDANGDQARGEVVVGVLPRPEENHAPVANDDNVTVGVGRTNLVVAVLANDSDADGDPMTVTRVSAPRRGTAAVAGGGTLVVFEPPADIADGDEISFTYDVQDGRGGTGTGIVSVLFRGSFALLPPVAVDDVVGPLAPGTTVEVPVLANDLDPDGNAAALRVGSDDPALTVLPNRSIRITAGASTTRHRYTVTDADGLTAAGVITVFVIDNEPPVIEPVALEVPFGEPVELDLTGQASDPDGDPLLFVCCDAREGAAEVLTTDPSELVVLFRPNDGFVGGAGFAYSVDDGQGHVVSSTVAIEILPPTNTPPSVEATPVQVEAGGVTEIDLLGFVTDPDENDELTVVSVGDPSSTSVGLTRRGDSVVLTAGIGAAGATAEVPFTVGDGSDTADGVLPVTVIPTTKAPPVARDDTQGLVTNQGESLTIDVLGNDVDPIGEGLTVVEASVTPAGTVAVAADRQSVVFTPKPDFFGAATFSYTIEDATGSPDRHSLCTGPGGGDRSPRRPAATERGWWEPPRSPSPGCHPRRTADRSPSTRSAGPVASRGRSGSPTGTPGRGSPTAARTPSRCGPGTRRDSDRGASRPSRSSPTRCRTFRPLRR